MSIYRQAYLFVWPSLYEGFGLPLLEAMSAGVPVVASNSSSLPEVVGDAAAMVDPTSTESIRKGIEDVLTNHGSRERLVQMGLERSKLFSWNKASEETLALFEQALSYRSGLKR